MTLTKIVGNLSFNYVPDKNNNQLPDTTIIYDNNGNNLGTIRALRDKHLGKNTSELYNDIYYDDNNGGGVSADAQRNPNAASVGKRIVAGGNLGNNYAYNYLKTISLDSL